MNNMSLPIPQLIAKERGFRPSPKPAQVLPSHFHVAFSANNLISLRLGKSNRRRAHRNAQTEKK